MNIIKRSGEEAPFEMNKILLAVKKANNTVAKREQLCRQEMMRLEENLNKLLRSLNRSIRVEEISRKENLRLYWNAVLEPREDTRNKRQGSSLVEVFCKQRSSCCSRMGHKSYLSIKCLHIIIEIRRKGVIMEKTFDELQIKDDFMFSVIMRNPKYCKPFIERILGIKISHIEYPKSQETIDLLADAKSVRLDIYVEDGKNTVYNVEMQTTWDCNLPKRTRYYQGMDGTTKIILNTKGTMDDVTSEIKKLLDFIDGKKPEDDFTRELDEAVRSIRKNEKWRLDYMTLQMNYQEKYEQGFEQGKIEAARKMIEDGDLPLEKIAMYSGLTFEQVQTLAEEELQMM